MTINLWSDKMRIIENINSIIRFFGYLLPFFLLVFNHNRIINLIDKIKWYHHDLWQLGLKLIYFGLVLCTLLFAAVAIYKLFRITNRKRYNVCKRELVTELKIRIARLAELDRDVEQYCGANHEWLTSDLAAFLDMYAREVGRVDFEAFVSFVNERAVVYFSHRVTPRDQFLGILNRL